MINNYKITLLILSIVILFSSCKKDSSLDPLSDVVSSKSGVIRIECTDCSLSYTVLKNNYAVAIKNSEDIQFNYVSNFELKTSIDSKNSQNVRLAVFDSYGRIISNELVSVNSGVSKTNTFAIKVEK